MSAAFDPKAFLEKAIRAYGPIPNQPSEFTAARLSLKAAEAETARCTTKFFEAALAWRVNATAIWKEQKQAKARLKEIELNGGVDDETEEQRQLLRVVKTKAPPPMQHGLKVGLGIGKTFRAIQGVRDYIAAARAAKVAPGVLWTAQTLIMADQTAGDLKRVGVRAHVYRGRRAPDPDASLPPENDDDDEGRMCLDLPAVRLANDADLPVSAHVCGSMAPGKPHCVFFETCAYQRNIAALHHAEVVVAAHQALFQAMPEKIDRKVGLTVIDESFWQVGLGTRSMPLDSLVADFEVAPVLHNGVAASFATRQLQATMTELSAVLSRHADGQPLTRSFLGLDAARCREAAGQQFWRIVHADMWPGMPLDERKAAVKTAGVNRRIRAMAALLHTIADFIDGTDERCGRIEMETADLKAGPERRVLLHFRQDMVRHTSAHPVLHLDATMPVRAVQAYLPFLEVQAEVQAVTPHMQVIQCLSARDDRGGWGKTSTIPDDRSTHTERKRRQRRVDELKDLFRGLVQQSGPGLVVTYKAMREHFTDIAGVSLGHFNAIAGLNSFMHVGWVAIVGRPMPRPEDTALIVRQLFGRWCEPQSPEEVATGLLMADGTMRSIRSRRYVDPDMELVRSAVADDNVVQALGRPRGVRRTADTPVLALLLNDCAAPFPIKAVTDWPTSKPNDVQRMAARGIVLASPKDAAKAYPDIFPSAKAAEHSISRSRSADFPPIPLYIINHRDLGGKSGHVLVRYRPEGRGQQTREAHVHQTCLSTCRQWFEDALGPLSTFEVLTSPAAANSNPVAHAPTEQPPSSKPKDKPMQIDNQQICLNPAAVYPEADEFSWIMMTPIVDFFQPAGRTRPIVTNSAGVASQNQKLFGAKPFSVPPMWAADQSGMLGRVHPLGHVA